MSTEKLQNMEATTTTTALEEGEAVCAYCGAIVNEESLVYVRGYGMVCEDCLNANFGWCEECEEPHHIDDLVRIDYYDRNRTYHRDVYLCTDCIDDLDLHRCNCCGEWYHRTWFNYVDGYEEGLCDDCYNDYLEENRPIIRDYHDHHGEFYPVTLAGENSHGKYFGIELEMDEGDEEGLTSYPDAIAQEMSDIIGGEEYVGFEHDCSLGYNGIEVISQPHTWEAWKSHANRWREALDYASGEGYRSHDTDTCGLHVHFSRAWFGADEDEQAQTLEHIYLLYDANSRFFEKLARREAGQYCEAVDDYYTSDRKLLKQIAKKEHNIGRYHTINNNNCKTIEFRLARGTMCYDSINAWIDVHRVLIENVKKYAWEYYDEDGEIENVMDNWNQLLKGIEPSTWEYLKRRNAYNNLLNSFYGYFDIESFEAEMKKGGE